MPDDDRKQGEIDESPRLLVDFGYVLQLLGCGSGWMTRFAARQASTRCAAASRASVDAGSPNEAARRPCPSRLGS